MGGGVRFGVSDATPGFRFQRIREAPYTSLKERCACYAVLRTEMPGYVTAARRPRALVLHRLETTYPDLRVITLATHLKTNMHSSWSTSGTFQTPSHIKPAGKPVNKTEAKHEYRVQALAGRRVPHARSRDRTQPAASRDTNSYRRARSNSHTRTTTHSGAVRRSHATTRGGPTLAQRPACHSARLRTTNRTRGTR